MQSAVQMGTGHGVDVRGAVVVAGAGLQMQVWQPAELVVYP